MINGNLETIIIWNSTVFNHTKPKIDLTAKNNKQKEPEIHLKKTNPGETIIQHLVSFFTEIKY